MNELKGGQWADETKRSLLKESYGELLDATKHQDDKIGRIVTGVSFLAAAVLALTNQIGVWARFDLVDRDAPLIAYALGVFVLGVVLTVVLLLSSLTTGLTLPGSKGPEDPTEPVSLIYFYSISRLTKRKWQDEWLKPSAALREQHDRSLVKETYNLALRTERKYVRTNEAVTVLWFTLFALACAFTLAVTVAAAGPRDPKDPVPVPFGLWARVCLAIVVSGYVAVQVFISWRDHELRVRVRGDTREGDRLRTREFAIYQMSAPAVAGALVVPGRGGAERLVAGVAIAGALSALLYALSLRRKRKKIEEPDAKRRGTVWRVAVVGVAAVGVSAVLAQREVTWRLAAASAVSFVLMLRGVIEHARRSRLPEISV